MVEVTILGCGASLGVPIIGCKCSTCMSNLAYNKRTRSSVLFTKNKKNILVDFGLDIRHQLIREKIDLLECAILTHDHADHVGGIDDLRVFSRLRGGPLPIYSDPETINAISKRYEYMLYENHIEMKKLDGFETQVTLADIDIQFFRQDHRNIDSLGIRIGNFVYTNDVIDYPKESEIFIANAKYWMIDCMDYMSTTAHFGLEKVMFWYEKFKPEFVYLVNMSHTIDYFEVQKHLPNNIKPSYDGFKLQIDG
jgi:phosphoribosyl 1,2-cyclic phosphate phosphodiesterase